MTETPQSAATGRNHWAGIPVNGTPAAGVLHQMLVSTAATRQRTNARRSDQELADLIDGLNQGRLPAASP